jgi:hypothetical protein
MHGGGIRESNGAPFLVEDAATAVAAGTVAKPVGKVAGNGRVRERNGAVLIVEDAATA